MLAYFFGGGGVQLWW